MGTTISHFTIHDSGKIGAVSLETSCTTTTCAHSRERQKFLLQIPVRRPQVFRSHSSQSFHQPVLRSFERALNPSVGLRRMDRDPLNVRILERPSDLALLLLRSVPATDAAGSSACESSRSVYLLEQGGAALATPGASAAPKLYPCHLPSRGPGNLGGKRYRPAWWTIGSASVSAISIATEW